MTTLSRLKELTKKLEYAQDQENVAAMRLKTVLSVVGAGVWDWDVETDTLRWDDRMVELFGYSIGDFKMDGGWHICSYSHFLDRVHEDDKHRVQNSIDNCLDYHRPYRITYRVVRPDHSEVSLILAAGDVYKTLHEHRLVGVCLPVEESTHNDR